MVIHMIVFAMVIVCGGGGRGVSERVEKKSSSVFLSFPAMFFVLFFSVVSPAKTKQNRSFQNQAGVTETM